MARTFTPRVNRHVTYFRSNGKPVPAVITAVGSTNGGIVLRVGRSGGTFGNGTTGILRGPVALDVANVANTWRPY